MACPPSLPAALLVLLPLVAPPAEGMSEVAEDERVLRAAGVGVDGPALLGFFRNRTTTEATQRGKIDPALGAAARDSHPLRRLAAAGALARAAGAEHRAAARALLRDPAARVRLGAARALLIAHDPSAVPALMALLEEGPAETA